MTPSKPKPTAQRRAAAPSTRAARPGAARARKANRAAAAGQKAKPRKPAKKAAPRAPKTSRPTQGVAGKTQKAAKPKKTAKPKAAPKARAVKPTVKRRATPATRPPKTKPRKQQPPKKVQRAPKAKAPAPRQPAAKPPVKPAPAPVFQPTGFYGGVLLHPNPKPFPAKSPYSKEELAKLREALLEERRQLLSSLASQAVAASEAIETIKPNPGFSQHSADHATDLQISVTDQDLLQVKQERLQRVMQALEKLEKAVSSYGLCMACGEKIGIQRLIAQPHAHLCLECQKRYEAKAHLRMAN